MKEIDWNGAAECLRVLSHPHRLKVIALLLRKDYSVGELAEACDVLQNVMSEHLNLMKHKGFVRPCKEGRKVFYTINEPMLASIIKCVKSVLPTKGGREMIEYLRKDRWSPYIVGLLIGVLLTILFAVGHQLGVSSGVARIGALINHFFSEVDSKSHFGKSLADGVIFNWKVLFIIGLFLGAFIASRLTKGIIPKKNTIWEGAFGTSKWKRYFAAFIGGVLILFGARLANGCTSGHAISGGAQLSITSWVFMLALFGAAIPVSFGLYRKTRRS